MQYWGPQQLADASFRSVIAGPSVDTIDDSLVPIAPIDIGSPDIIAMPTSFIGEEEVKASSNTDTQPAAAEGEIKETTSNTVTQSAPTAAQLARTKVVTDYSHINLLVELEKRGKIKPDTEAECHSLIRDAHAFGHFGRLVILVVQQCSKGSGTKVTGGQIFVVI